KGPELQRTHGEEPRAAGHAQAAFGPLGTRPAGGRVVLQADEPGDGLGQRVPGHGEGAQKGRRSCGRPPADPSFGLNGAARATFVAWPCCTKPLTTASGQVPSYPRARRIS